MPFFHGPTDVTVANSSFFEIGGDYLNINLTTQDPAAAFSTQLLGKRKERGSSDFDVADELRKRYRYSSRNSDGLMIVNTDEIELRTELISRTSYRIHSASHGTKGRVVAVKLFEGSYAKQDWINNVAFLRKFLHSNMPKIVGVSDETSEVPFIVLHGISEKRIQSLIAKALRTELNKSVELSMKAVKGLAAGLNYINSQIVLKQLINGRGWENFDIFVGDNEEPIIAISLPSEGDMVLDSFDLQSDLEVFDGLCQKLFSEVNSVLYDDSPQRELDKYDTEGLLSASIKEVSEGSSNISENEAANIATPLNPTEKPKLTGTPRREVRWQFDKGKNNSSLDSIARRFGDFLDCFLSSSSDPQLRRIKVSKDAYSGRRTYHRCPGYLREEISLTSSVSRSAIISHDYPSQSELCSVCGQLVIFGDRPLDVNGALNYLDALRVRFQGQPDIYNHFLEIMKDFKSQVIDTRGVIERISILLNGHPSFIQGFNTFLPNGYWLKCTTDALDSTFITLITPSGTMQATGRPGQGLSWSNASPSAAQDEQSVDPAVRYVQKVKQHCDPNTYRQFLDILSRYHHSPDPIDEEEVSKQINIIFEGAPDLGAEFRVFMPDRREHK